LKSRLNKNNKSYHVKKPREKGMRVPHLRKHILNLCEACARGICDNYNADGKS
jgi:hypothetical protein